MQVDNGPPAWGGALCSHNLHCSLSVAKGSYGGGDGGRRQTGETRGGRAIAWEKGNESRSPRSSGCKKEGQRIEVISEDEPTAKGPLLCVCVLGLNSFTVWRGTGVGGLDLDTCPKLSNPDFRDIQRSLSVCKLPLTYSFQFFFPKPTAGLGSMSHVPVFCTHLLEIFDNYSAAF